MCPEMSWSSYYMYMYLDYINFLFQMRLSMNLGNFEPWEYKEKIPFSSSFSSYLASIQCVELWKLYIDMVQF